MSEITRYGAMTFLCSPEEQSSHPKQNNHQNLNINLILIYETHEKQNLYLYINTFICPKHACQKS